MRLPKLPTIVLLCYLFLSSCAGIKDGIIDSMPFLAGGACALGINHAMSQFNSSLTRNLTALAGGVMCGVIGKELGKYLKKQDYENIAKVLEDPKPQKQSWCSGSSDFTVTNGCGDQNQVSVTTQAFSSSGGKKCRDYLTEIKTPDGDFKTVEANTCDDAMNARLEIKQMMLAMKE